MTKFIYEKCFDEAWGQLNNCRSLHLPFNHFHEDIVRMNERCDTVA